jgi:LacI family transcriptional regulator
MRADGTGGPRVASRSSDSRRRAGMREVAALAGVAMSSVSRVLSGHPDVSTPMRVRVLAAVNELGYEPDFLAQSLRRGATLSVGFVVGDISNPIMADVALGAEQALRAAGYSMLLMNSEGDPGQDADHIRFFQSRRVDGMILSLASERKRATVEALLNVEAPVVVLDREVPARIGASAVLSDHRSGMRTAVEYLLDLGHRRIALITGSVDIRPVRERLAGLRDAIAGRGIPDQTITMPGSLLAEHGQAATDDVLDLAKPPTALIAGGNQVLIGCLRSLAGLGLKVGHDISLVTCDDVPLSELYPTPIATIWRDNVAIGRTAAELLLKRLAGEPPATLILPTVFRPRASCAPPSRT